MSDGDQVGRLRGIFESPRRCAASVAPSARPQSRGAPRHLDLIDCQWGAPSRPDQWGVADFTYGWTLQGFVHTAFCVDVLSRRVLGWRMMSTKATPLVSSVFEQAIFTRTRTALHSTAMG